LFIVAVMVGVTFLVVHSCCYGWGDISCCS
jgi:hypothetical protein